MVKVEDCIFGGGCPVYTSVDIFSRCGYVEGQWKPYRALELLIFSEVI